MIEIHQIITTAIINKIETLDQMKQEDPDATTAVALTIEWLFATSYLLIGHDLTTINLIINHALTTISLIIGHVIISIIKEEILITLHGHKLDSHFNKLLMLTLIAYQLHNQLLI